MTAQVLEKKCGSPYPQELDAVLDPTSSGANSCQFNRTGSMIAVGSTDGRVAIMDYNTHAIAKLWNAHAGPVTSVSWSHDSRRLLTAACDGTVAIWNVLNTATPVDRFHFGAGTKPVHAFFNPRDDQQQILVFTKVVGRPPVLVDLESGEKLELTYRSMLHGEDVCTVAFGQRGEYVLCGTNKGRILVFGTLNGRIANAVSQQSLMQIKNFAVSRRGGFVFTNTQDTICCYSLAQIRRAQEGSVIEPIQRFVDVVNYTTWKSICASAEGDYVCGASAKEHVLCIWERSSGNLIMTLNGTMGKLISDVQWHPTRPVLLSVASGLMSVWAEAHVDSGSVFGPGYTSVEESDAYQEREDEFDFADEDDHCEQEKAAVAGAEGEVDVISTKLRNKLWLSDNKGEPEDFFLPFYLWLSEKAVKTEDFVLPIDTPVDQLEDPLYQLESKAVDGDRQSSGRGRKSRATSDG